MKRGGVDINSSFKLDLRLSYQTRDKNHDLHFEKRLTSFFHFSPLRVYNPLKQTNPEPILGGKSASQWADIFAWDYYDVNLQGETMPGG